MRSLRPAPILTLALLLLCGGTRAQSTRIKDITRPEGVRANQLVGYGLVVGLEGTGDSKQTVFTTQSLANMLSRLGVEAGGDIKVKNVAAVMLTAQLPAFARPGDAIDVSVSSLGDARSLQGGTLLQSPLQGADGETYAVAQGALSIGGFAAGGGGASVTKNHPTVGRIPNGALVEKDVPMAVTDGSRLSFSLQRPDFTTASRIVKAIEESTGATASADDAGRIRVEIPEKYRSNPVAFMSIVGELPVEAEPVSKVVINERTGTIVIGGAARISPVALAQGSLTVSIATTPVISQPEPKSHGETVVVPQKDVSVEENRASTLLLKSGDTIEDLIKALNAVKATPRDIIAILQAVKEAGALHGELEIL
jgi:flagellar P-ring protein precursor FlgI